ncbi:hypothetical protein [Anaerococcus tetradius]|nr:hypothetical protein [Anaerococcus tetradius]
MISTYELNKAKQAQRYRNRQSNGFGKNFEKFVAMACDFYREKGIADISKVDEPFRVIRLLRNGRFEGRFTRKANPDFECKYTSKDRILQSVITKRQAEVLDRKYRLGGLVGVCCGIGDRYFFVPWEVWANMEAIWSKKSVSADDLREYEVPFRQGILFLVNIGGDYDTSND